MKKIYSLPFILFGLSFLSSTYSNAQLYNIGNGITPQDVNNAGVVASSAGNVATLRWTVEDGLQEIGTLAIAEYMGKPLVGEDGNKIIAYLTNPETQQNEISIFDFSNKSAIFLGGIESSLDNSKSSPWGITNDGKAIVGLGWSATGKGRAIKWTEEEGFTTLEHNENVSSRANSISDDKSTIVGWQDQESGFRQASVRKNGVQTLIYDAQGNPVSELGEISGNGKYAIGANGYNAYIWNEDTGVTYITHPNAGMFFRGGATSITEDGSKVIGYFRGWPGPPALGEGFIWDETNGRVNLNEYVESLGIDTKNLILSLPLAISPDGTKIVGVARDNNYNLFGFYLDLTNYLNTTQVDQNTQKINVYPNPVKDILSVEGITGEASLTIHSLTGQKLKETSTKTGKINVADLTKGTYIITIKTNKQSTSIKFIKN